MIRYWDIIKQAWRITIHNRWLWVIGLFAAMLSNIGQYNSLLNALDGGGWVRFLNSLSSYWHGGLSLVNSALHDPLLFIGSLLGLVIIVALLFFAINSQILLVQKIQASIKSEGKKSLPAPKMSFWQQIKTNGPTFWLTVGLIISIKLVLFIGLVIVSLSMAGAYLIRQPIISIFVYIFFVLFFLILIWLIGMWGRYWLFLFLSDKKSSWTVSAKKAWKMLYENLLPSLEMFIIVILMNILVSLVWIFIIGLLAIPYSLLSLLLIRYLSLSEVLLTIVAEILLIAGFMVVIGMITVLEYSLWLSFIDKLSNKKIVAKIGHVFHRS